MADISKQLEQQVLAAKADLRQLEIIGGGSKSFLGRQPQGEPLHVGGHKGIVSYQPVELVLTARAGTTLDEIDATLHEHGQLLAFEPPRFSGADTIGGTLACNLSGPGRPWQGSVRDHVLGIRLLNGRGEHLRFGGQVMKNVAGYDVSRLQAGAMGTLGVITEVSLKVLPKPAMGLTLVQAMPVDEAVQVMNQRAAQPKPMTAACWLDGQLYTRLSGAQAAVEATAQQWGGGLLADADAFWRGLRDQQHGFFAGDKPLWRFSVRPTAALSPLPGEWLLDWGGAQRWYRGGAEFAAMEALAASQGGQVALFRGGDREAEVFHAQPAALAVLQTRLKASFDPAGVFNPGRVYSWM